MEERKQLRSLYETAEMKVVIIEASDVIVTSVAGDYEESSGGDIDTNWDVN